MANKNQPLVSVIVPIYNVEPYIEQGVKSLLNQDYSAIEIILVDDGSPDNCGRIIDALAETDSRIKVIHKENGGVSAARNDGLKIAKGDYIMFVDGDDFVEPDYVSYFVSMMEESDCGIGVGKNTFCKEGQEQITDDLIKKVDALDVVEGIYLNMIGVGVVNKIYRHDVIKESELSFKTDYWYAEGMMFNILYLQKVPDAVTGDRRVYHICANPESATRSFRLESQYCGMRSMVLQKKSWLKTNLGVQTAWEYHFRMYAKHILQGLILTGGKKSNRKLYRKCISALRRNLKIPLRAELSERMKEDSILMAICPTGFIRDELGIVHAKGDNSDFVSRKVLSLARKLFSRISEEKKAAFFEKLKVRLQKHYKPVNLEKNML